MPSIVTAVPSGPFQDWCIQVPWFDNALRYCGNSTESQSDFETICCDGVIVDTKEDIVTALAIDLADLVCCRIQGPQSGTIAQPTEGPVTQCTTGTPVPLASLAATNTHNVQDYLVTYPSVALGPSTTGDFVPTLLPFCLWVKTVGGVAMMNVTVSAAQITTLGSTSYAVSTTSSSAGGSSSPTTNAVHSSSSTSSAAGQGSSTSTKASPSSRVTFKSLWLLGFLCAGATVLPQYL